MNSRLIFKREEKKYVLNDCQFNEFISRISEFVSPDEYGQYTINNIYFDTQNNDLVRTSIDKPVYKEKLRLRSYGIPDEDSNVFIEIKKKYKGTVYKRRITLPYKVAVDYLYHNVIPESLSQIFNEIDYFIKFHKTIPRLYLAYDRIAFCGKEDKNLRITFDDNIRYREDNLFLCEGDEIPLFKNKKYVMEIKSPSALPLWLVKILSEMKIYPTTFSKYGNIYKQIIKRGSEICLQVY